MVSAPSMMLELPVLPLRDVVVFPHMVVSLVVGREKSMRALARCMETDRRIFLLTQKTSGIDDPTAEDVYTLGTAAHVLQLLKLQDGSIKVLVEGLGRVQMTQIWHSEEGLDGQGHRAFSPSLHSPSSPEEREIQAMTRSLLSLFAQYLKTPRKLPPDLLDNVRAINSPGRLADTIAAHIKVSLKDKQKLLETLPIGERMKLLIGLLDSELDVQQTEKRIRSQVKTQMEKSRREYYLHEKIKVIQKELSELGESTGENDELAKRIEESSMPKEIKAKAQKELEKLKKMAPTSGESAVTRNYLETLLTVPWGKRSRVHSDLTIAQDTLDADHYGLEKVKERIVEYLAVQSRVKKIKGPVLCLVGPPGVGKTSLGQSIAKATGRKFARIALGGVRDEAEIRGHRRTYIGAMPGRIVQSLIRSGKSNPLFVLDEIDKMSMDFRGDPSSALLEVLDPEQNNAFNDHYLDVDLDLSQVMFIATANSLTIPGPLLDRMEIIRIPGYTEEEKVNIASRYLIPKQMKANGLKKGELRIEASAIVETVRYYTRESGVRNLEREIAKICRKTVRDILLAQSQAAKDGAPYRRKKELPIVVNETNIGPYLGVRKVDFGRAAENNEIGLVTGLAWTEVGGDLLYVESTLIPGKGAITLTGQLGDVMRESATAALSVVRARAEVLGIDAGFLEKHDVHLHVPDGATPKDGPSAGIAMVTSLVSTLTRVPVKAEVAMTGEITLRGRVTAIGGLKEKLLAALRGGITTVLIPEDNRKDLADIPPNVTDKLRIVPVKWIDQVLDLALETPLVPKTVEAKESSAHILPIAVEHLPDSTVITTVTH